MSLNRAIVYDLAAVLVCLLVRDLAARARGRRAAAECLADERAAHAALRAERAHTEELRNVIALGPYSRRRA